MTPSSGPTLGPSYCRRCWKKIEAELANKKLEAAKEQILPRRAQFIRRAESPSPPRAGVRRSARVPLLRRRRSLPVGVDARSTCRVGKDRVWRRPQSVTCDWIVCRIGVELEHSLRPRPAHPVVPKGWRTPATAGGWSFQVQESP